MDTIGIAVVLVNGDNPQADCDSIVAHLKKAFPQVVDVVYTLLSDTEACFTIYLGER